MSDIQDSPLALQLRDAQVTESDATTLQATFLPYYQEAEKWAASSRSIEVTSVDDVTGMRKARAARLALKEIRINVERQRKEMKEESLRKGKAIDGVANWIKFLIVPLEEHLEKQENFAKVLEEQRMQARKAERERELAQYGVDPAAFDLLNMQEEGFVTLRDSSKAAFEATQEAVRKQEQERLAKQKADADERERMRVENERLKKEAAVRQAEIEQERKERAKIEADLKAKKDAEDKARREQAAIDRQAKLAPDKEKLVALADRITKIELPDVASDEAKEVIRHTIELLSKTSQFIKTQSVNL